MVGRVEVPHFVGYAAIADGTETIINKAIVDQFFQVLFWVVAVVSIAHILGSCHIYITVEIRHFFVGGIVRAHIELAGDHGGVVAQF